MVVLNNFIQEALDCKSDIIVEELGEEVNILSNKEFLDFITNIKIKTVTEEYFESIVFETVDNRFFEISIL